MTTITIENPIINSPFTEPTRYYEFDEQGITGRVLEGRRRSSYITPVPKPRKRGAVPELELFDEEERENELINRIRREVSEWRKRGYPFITRMTRTLLEYWRDDKRERRLFFCQIEALETVIYLTEAARHDAVSWHFIDNALNTANHTPALTTRIILSGFDLPILRLAIRTSVQLTF